jgi:hypothetical protein
MSSNAEAIRGQFNLEHDLWLYCVTALSILVIGCGSR